MSGEQSRPWSPVEVVTKMQTVIERKEDALTALYELGVIRDQTKYAYERAKMNAVLAGKVKGRNTEERRAKMMAVQVKPGQQIIDLMRDRDGALTAFQVAEKTIVGYNDTGKMLTSMHVSHRDAGPDQR